jgi:hypothetical protein
MTATWNTAWVPGDSDHEAAEPAHTTDSHCTLDENDECKVCGVYHGDPCPGCGGSGFHYDGCLRMLPEPPLSYDPCPECGGNCGGHCLPDTRDDRMFGYDDIGGP